MLAQQEKNGLCNKQGLRQVAQEIRFPLNCIIYSRWILKVYIKNDSIKNARINYMLISIYSWNGKGFPRQRN